LKKIKKDQFVRQKINNIMIGLIFGETDFPKEILKKIRNKKKYTIIDLTKKKVFKKDKNSFSVSIGQFGKIIKILKSKKCKKIIFAGKVRKPKFSKLRFDLKGVYHISKIIRSSKLGDAAVLKEIINIFKKENIITISSLFFNPELTLKKGNYTKIKPNKKDKTDIKKAIITLNSLGKYNFSQGTVVRNKKIVAIEGIGGTQKMLKKCKSKKFKNNGVLVKFPKVKQDLRIDLPTVGLKTLIACKSAGLKGIVLRSKQNVFLERKKCINFANKNKMFVIAK
jgi:UDP-2,3-diacylglucosamine hydrolase